MEKEPVEEEPVDKELRPISNADLDKLAPGRHYRNGKTERTIDFDNKSMDLSMTVLGINENGYYAEVLVAEWVVKADKFGKNDLLSTYAYFPDPDSPGKVRIVCCKANFNENGGKATSIKV